MGFLPISIPSFILKFLLSHEEFCLKSTTEHLELTISTGHFLVGVILDLLCILSLIKIKKQNFVFKMHAKMVG